MKAVAIRALDLLAELERQPSTQAEVCDRLSWTGGTFLGALRYARSNLCPEIGLAIPHPVPEDGWKYRVTGAWLHDDGSPAIATGTDYAIGLIESRLHSVLRDVNIAAGNVDSVSYVGRKCNFLRKHLTHILCTLSEIGPKIVEDEE